MVLRNDHPQLAQEAAIVMPKDLQLPNNDLPNLGDPRTSVVGPASNGTGAMSGMGTGAGGGIGSGRGNGYGPGEGGGYGGGLYHVGGGVAAPQLIYSVDPEFSDEARRAKFQGVCVVSLVVDAREDNGKDEAMYLDMRMTMTPPQLTGTLVCQGPSFGPVAGLIARP